MLYAAAVLNPFRKTIRARESLLGLAFNAYKRDVIGRSIFKTGGHEPAVSKWLISKYRDKEGLFIDVGANLGYFTCLLSRTISPKSCVYAFEPEPENLALLESNVAINGLQNVTIYPIALGEKNSVARLNVYKESNRGRHSLQGQSTGRTIEVTVKTLDDLLTLTHEPGDLPWIEFMKIDVEGHESHVLRGGAEAIKRTRCLMLEYSPYLMNMQTQERERFLKNLATNFSTIREVTEEGLKDTSVAAVLRRADQFDLIFEK